MTDAREEIRTYLETHLTPTNITKDDNTTLANFIVCFGYPNNSLKRVFKDKDVDLIFSIGESDTEALLDTNQEIYGYNECLPIAISCVDKMGITGTNLKWKAEAELRRVIETYPGFSFIITGQKNKRLFKLRYKRQKK